MKQLTNNFYLHEFIESPTALRMGIDNKPNCDQEENIFQLCKNILQPARDWLNDTIYVTSGYRCILLNVSIGGSSTSDHVHGKAADIKCKDNAKLFHYIRENLEYDQIIWEFGNDKQPRWIHVSFRTEGNRKQALRAYKDEDNKTHYIKWGY